MKTNCCKLSALVGVLLVFGCNSKALKIVVFDTTKRAPTEMLDVFKNGETPKRTIKDIGELWFEKGPQDEEEKVLALFVAEGKRMGAQAIIIEKNVPRVVQHGDFGRDTIYLFKARVAVYE